MPTMEEGARRKRHAARLSRPDRRYQRHFSTEVAILLNA
jgi:hypothetical protein